MQLPPVLKMRSVHLLSSLLLLLLFYPFAELMEEPWGGRLSSVLTTGVMLTAVWWTADSRHHRLMSLVLVGPALICFWMRHFFGPVATIGWILFCFYVIGRLLRAVLGSRLAFVDRIVLAMSVYLLFAMTFAYLHLMILNIHPGAYHFPGEVQQLPVGEGMVDMLYFSLVTILTLGYGDVVPVDPFAKMLTVIEAFFGAFFIAILVARLISQGARDAGAGHAVEEESASGGAGD